MKVVAKTTIVDKIMERLEALRRQNREPEYIVVTREEYRELRDDLRSDHLLYNDFRFMSPGDSRMSQATFTTRDFQRRRATGHGCPYLRVATHEQFMGVPLYVVPAEYHPD